MSKTPVAEVLERSRPWFEEFRSTIEFCEQFEQIRKTIDGDFQFNRSDAKWLLEAWLLKEYGLIIGAASIRLNPNDPPDAYVQIGERTVGIEMTEVLQPDRKRGLEFRPGAPTVSVDPVEKWIERANIIPSALVDRLQAKQSRRMPYPAGTELLIYLNISEYGIRQREIEAEIDNLLARKCDPFAAVHILWKEKLFSSSGETRNHPNLQYAELMGDDGEIFRSTFEESD